MRSVLTVLCLLYSFDAMAQEGKIEPFDESSKDPSLVKFIERLKKALEERDQSYIRSIIASKSYIPREGGETTTPEQFYNFYFVEKGHRYDLWKSLEYVFDIGGGGFKEGGTEYFMPYTSANLHNGRPFEELSSHVIALSDKTPVYEKLFSNSTIIAHVNYEILRVDPEKDRGYSWVPILLKDSIKGYIKSSDVINTIDIRCGLILEEGKWKLKFAGYYE